MAVFSLGQVQFEPGGVNVDTFARAWEWKHLFQGAVSGQGSRQYTGRGADTISIGGVVFPGQFGDRSAVETLRELGDTGEPQLLTDGTGAIYGRFVVQQLGEDRAYLDEDGQGRQVTYRLELRKDPRDV